ncbi:MAG: trypsin-like peptidase domain-containing protein [Patescibacteria group bacterium]
MSKRTIILIIIAGLVGGFFGSLATSRFAQANLLDDVWSFIKGGLATSTPQANIPKIPEAVLYNPTIDYEEAVMKAVEKASPSVVSIVISKDLPIIEQCQTNPFSNIPPEFRDFFGDRFGNLPGQGFSQLCQKGTKKQDVGGGSGFIISADGMILTNKHVVADTAAEYTVVTNSGKKYDAKVLARDPMQDLAVLKIEATDLPVVALGNSDTLKLGQTAIAIGNSLGEFRNTVSVGVISGLSRTITATGASIGTEIISNVIQTDAAINPGNSGGPLLNLKGEVIGINTAVAEGAQSIGFTIPINQAKRDINSVRNTGAIKIPYLGVRYMAVTEGGALVRGSDDGPAILKDSPAAKAGLEAEDIILEINGIKVDENNSLGNLIQRYSVGESIMAKIRRGLPGQGGKTLDLSITLTERPAE